MRCKNVQEVARLRPRHPCHLFSEEPGRRREAAMAVSKAALVLLVLSLVSSAYGAYGFNAEGRVGCFLSHEGPCSGLKICAEADFFVVNIWGGIDLC